MDDDVQNLVLAPFQEVVEKSKTALDNATEAGLTKSDDMFKAAQSLVRDGEKALKKIEPICKKHWEEYSSNFVVALKENDEIADFRNQLNDQLWDFESFIEVDDFDASEFSKLQTLLRKATLRIHETLVRMKLEPPPIAFHGFDSAGVSRATSLAGRSVGSDMAMPSTEPPHTIEEEAATLMGTQAGPDLGYENGHAESVPEPQPSPRQDMDSRELARPPDPESPIIPHQLYANSVRVEDIPPEPSLDPWQPNNPPVVALDDSNSSGPLPERRRRLSSLDSERPSTPPFIVSNAFGEPNGIRSRPRRLDEGVEALTHEEITREAVPGNGFAADSSRPGLPSSGDQRSLSKETPPLPSQLKGLPTPPIPSPGGYVAGTSQPVRRVLSSQRYSQASSTNSRQSSLFDPVARDSMVSPVTDMRESVHEDYNQSPVRTEPHETIPEEEPEMSGAWHSTTNPSPVVRAGASSGSAQADTRPQSTEQPGLIVARYAEELEQPGLEVLSGDGSAPGVGGLQQPVLIREPNCNITIDSSFYQMKGFCDGAKDIIRGGVGVRKVRKGGIAAANTVVAKCTNKSCMFELEWKSVEADVNKSEEANYTTQGIGFRLRFISKSHLPSRNIDDRAYGCLFCIQLGRTPEESDATVFPTQKALFAHLARHPRPLPAVPGLTVVEGGAQVPAHFRNNYDLHLPDPPARSLLAGLAREIASLPAAVAAETHRRTQLSALRVAPDATAGLLQFFAGQRIVGVEFPERLGGEWAMGWADNVRGAFPVECVRLEAPPERELRKTAGSGLKAVARWKRHPREKEVKEGWLRFEKGEVITNISFPYPEYWCWYGSNSKGKYGIFPQSHMEPNTLSETTTAGDGASVVSHESIKAGPSRMLAPFANLRRRDTRPTSSAGSHSSGDTATQLSPRPTLYN